MAFVTKDRVKVTSTSVGTGSFTLGAAFSGYQSFSVIGDGNQTYYAIVGESEWEVGIGTSSSSGTVLSRDYVIASSNSNQNVNFSSGTKEVYVTQPTLNSQGKIPVFDDNSISADKISWSNFQKVLYKSANSGALFARPAVQPINLYAKIGYWGGVLDMEGNIQMVPSTASVGQKILASSENTMLDIAANVSTYSLAYTSTSSAYRGGVLAPNGDIHFVPYLAPVGQKISKQGTVSTYSLAFTSANGAYVGGVLAPNGDIHFIPNSATVGQKISSTGAVSTYSLAHTSANAYRGGVLAANGDIHFVPYGTGIGQKISALGTVSTYSLVYTVLFAYSGGVISPNGDIHFVPSRAAVGQKISENGVVSTYSLSYTHPTLDSYSGGVLAPNGDIHFVPSSAVVGQKVSLYGAVSTYSIPYTSQSYEGGVLSQYGNIYFIPKNVSFGSLVVYTNCGIPFNFSTCISSYLNKY